MLLLAGLLATAPLNSETIETPVVEQRVLLAWEGKHDFLVDFSAPFIPTTGNLFVSSIGKGVFFNHAYPWNWSMQYAGDSYIETCLTLTQEQAQKKWNLGLSQLASLGWAPNGQRGYAPVSIEVNGEIIESHYEPLVEAWRQDFFPVALQEGDNSIVIRLLGDATTNYWIEKLWLDPISE